MEVETEDAERTVVESSLHNIERRRLLADKQHLLALCNEGANDVGDGLALPRPRGAMDDQALARLGLSNSNELTVVSGQHCEQLA